MIRRINAAAARRAALAPVALLALVAFLVAPAAAPAAPPTAVPEGSAGAGAAAAGTETPAKLVVAFQPQENPLQLQPNAEKMAAHLSAALGLPVEVYLPNNYAAVIEAMRAGHAHVAYFSAQPYVMAHQMAGAEILVAEVRGDGFTTYWSQWYARKDSGIATLEDARGKRAAFTSPTSTSGYLFPHAELVRRGLIPQAGDPGAFFSEFIFAGGYQQALVALANGQVDVAAASDYAFERYLTPEQRENVVVIARQGPVPSHLMAIKNTIAPELRAKLLAALLDLNSDANKALLKDVYGAEGFREVTHEEHVAALGEAMHLTGADVAVAEQAAAAAAAAAQPAAAEAAPTTP